MDLVIRGGTVVDGTGAAPRTADVAIADGIIREIGQVSAKGAEEIDAQGALVTPGFVDIHTHLDAQLGWDRALTPLSWHGITTALIGNCGVTFAPCKPGDRETLAAMMETVEDIPKDAILTGLPWDWESYGGYLDALERLGNTLNIAGLVGHSAVRTYVMGARAYEDVATAEERAQMEAVVAEALAAGAFGFSVNRFDAHKGPDGRAIPGTFAEVGELQGLARRVSAAGGLVQLVGSPLAEVAALADAGPGRVLFSYGTGSEAGDGRVAAERLDALCEGRNVTAIAHVRGSGYLFGLQAGVPILGDRWRALRRKDLAGRLAELRDGDARAALLAEGKAMGAKLPLEQAFPLGTGKNPDYVGTQSLGAIAEAAGEHWIETFVRLSLESEGRALFNFRMFSMNVEELAGLYGSEHLYPGLGDAGAHVSQIMDAGWSTFLLSYWVRDRGHFSIEEAIRRMTSGPAAVLGLKDRGVLAEGLRADVNVIDLARVGERQPEIVHDFPGGAPRYTQRAEGYLATVINGVVTLRNDELTGAAPGQVLRHRA
jgi:N-acyl-D-amino-acid deacylase